MSLAGGWDRWRESLEESLKMQRMAQRTLGRWMNSAMYGAFESWQEHAREQRRLSDVCAKLVQRWVRAILL